MPDVKIKKHYEVELTSDEVNKLNKEITKIKNGVYGSNNKLYLLVEQMVAMAYVAGVKQGKADCSSELEL